ncbi:putative RNA-directed DNA polymerase [Dioscorea sansibarensis]
MFNRTSGKMISGAKLKDGLYYFVDEDSENKMAHGHSSVCSTSVKDQVLLWHNRLGHPSFNYLTFLLPQLFKDVNCSNVICENCILSKSHKSSYSLKSYKPSKPFHLIHNDVWGPSKVKTNNGKKWFVPFIMIALGCVGFF